MKQIIKQKTAIHPTEVSACLSTYVLACWRKKLVKLEGGNHESGGGVEI
jgi:hypothetical protein